MSQTACALRVPRGRTLHLIDECRNYPAHDTGTAPEPHRVSVATSRSCLPEPATLFGRLHTFDAMNDRGLASG